MLKAILYYILLIAEFIITIFIGGLGLGFFMTYYTQKHTIADKATFMSDVSPIIITFSLLSMVIVWFTFYKAKFSKFTLGKVRPTIKWKAMLYTSLPMLGFTLAYYAAMSILHIHFLPKEMTELGYLSFIPYAIVGSFFSAYVFYGAIQEELIRCGKQQWVQLLTLILMMLPASMMSVSEEGNISWEHLGVLGILSTCYGFWIYGKTRSTIILFAVYFLSNLVPAEIDSMPLPFVISLFVVGLALTVGGGIVLHKNLPIMIEKDENNPY